MCATPYQAVHGEELVEVLMPDLGGTQLLEARRKTFRSSQARIASKLCARTERMTPWSAHLLQSCLHSREVAVEERARQRRVPLRMSGHSAHARSVLALLRRFGAKATFPVNLVSPSSAPKQIPQARGTAGWGSCASTIRAFTRSGSALSASLKAAGSFAVPSSFRAKAAFSGVAIGVLRRVCGGGDSSLSALGWGKV